jgi:hypothetical protein
VSQVRNADSVYEAIRCTPLEYGDHPRLPANRRLCSQICLTYSQCLLLRSLRTGEYVRVRGFKFYLLWLAPFLFFSPLARADYREIERALPRVYRAFVQTIGEQRTHELFAHFSAQDSKFIGEKLSSFLVSLEESKYDREKTKLLVKDFGRRINGSIAEAIGLSRLREHYKGKPQIRIIDEVQFAIENGLHSDSEGRYRPDGLAVEVNGNSLVIHEVMESKLGGLLDFDQVQNWMRQWRRDGLKIDGVVYSPGEIFFYSSPKNIPLKGLRWTQVLPYMVWVAGSNPTSNTGRNDVLGLSKEDRRILLANLGAGGNKQDFEELNKFQNRFKDAVKQAVVDRIHSGEYPFPSSQAEGKDGKLGRAISGQWGNTTHLFNALPKYLRHKALKMGFDPSSIKASSRRAFGNATHSKETVRQGVIDRINAGKYPFPSQSDTGADRALAVGISSHYGKMLTLFETLPKSLQKKSIALGFDPANPNRSSQQSKGYVIWDKDSVKQAIAERIRLGMYPFPFSTAKEEDRSLISAIERYWGGRTALFGALPQRLQVQAIQLGFDPDHPEVSSRRSQGGYRYSKEAVRKEAIERIKSNANPFPPPQTEEEKGFTRAVHNHWKTQSALLESLPKAIQKKAVDLGLVPQRYTADKVREAVIDRLKRGKFPFPSRRKGSDDDRKLGEAISSHWKTQRTLFAALPKRWQIKARRLGFNPEPPPPKEQRIASQKNADRVSDRKSWLKTTVENRIRAGQYPFPSGIRTPADKNFRSMVSYHWGGVLKLFQSLDPELAQRAKDLGFDPENIIGSGKKFLGSAHRSKESVKKAVVDRMEAGLYPFPSRRAGPEESALSAAISEFWGGFGSIFDDLSTQHQAKAVELGFNPATGRRFHRVPCNKALALLNSKSDPPTKNSLRKK